MNKILSIVIVLTGLWTIATAQPVGDAAELNRLLNEFLAGAGRNDAAVHERFWSEDLVYTRGTGQRIGKADLMKGVRSATPAKPDDATTVYTAEAVRIREYGNTAVVAFKLVGTTNLMGKQTVSLHLNTGTFVKQNGRWQAVAWQATRIPIADEDARKQVLFAEAEFRRAVAAGDVRTVEQLLHPSFVWVHSSGIPTDRAAFITSYVSSKVRYAKMEIRDITVSIYGDTAVVRGVSPRQVEAASAAESKLSPDQFVLHYTITLVHNNGRWLIVAGHSSRSAS